MGEKNEEGEKESSRWQKKMTTSRMKTVVKTDVECIEHVIEDEYYKG